mmetsp:Transcript_34312/g.86733  ORF Transcript_34312/g.86733 Transcript_34312/m.86733 type:complete len:211 (+) Transcript_34312:610-1242(+)
MHHSVWGWRQAQVQRDVPRGGEERAVQPGAGQQQQGLQGHVLEPLLSRDLRAGFREGLDLQLAFDLLVEGFQDRPSLCGRRTLWLHRCRLRLRVESLPIWGRCLPALPPDDVGRGDGGVCTLLPRRQVPQVPDRHLLRRGLPPLHQAPLLQPLRRSFLRPFCDDEGAPPELWEEGGGGREHIRAADRLRGGFERTLHQLPNAVIMIRQTL